MDTRCMVVDITDRRDHRCNSCGDLFTATISTSNYCSNCSYLSQLTIKSVVHVDIHDVCNHVRQQPISDDHAPCLTGNNLKLNLKR